MNDGDKLKKKKIIAIFLMLIFIALPLAEIAGANSQKEENDMINLEYSIFRADGSQINKDITISKDELDLFNEMIPKIFDAVIKNNKDDINKILKDLETEYGQNSILSIISTISAVRPLQKRVLILSNGYGTKFDLRLRSDISIRRPLTFWHYIANSDLTTSSMTVIIDPIPNISLKFIKVLNGWQVGMMSRFIGFYMRIPGKITEQKQIHTFFFGYAVKVRSIDLPDM